MRLVAFANFNNATVLSTERSLILLIAEADFVGMIDIAPDPVFEMEGQRQKVLENLVAWLLERL